MVRLTRRSRQPSVVRNGDLGVMLLGELQMQQAVVTVVLHGDLDLVTIEDLRALLEKAAEHQPSRLVIDLSDVPFVDVLSLSAVLATADLVRDVGGAVVVRGASGSVRRMCRMFNAE